MNVRLKLYGLVFVLFAIGPGYVLGQQNYQTGTCVDANGNVGRYFVQGGLFCDTQRVCAGLSSCPPAPNPVGGCAFWHTENYIWVGDCVASSNSNCKQCMDASGSTGGLIACMNFQYYATNAGAGTCATPCGTFFTLLDGTCLPPGAKPINN